MTSLNSFRLHEENAGATAALLLPQSESPSAKTKQDLTRAFSKKTKSQSGSLYITVRNKKTSSFTMVVIEQVKISELDIT